MEHIYSIPYHDFTRHQKYSCALQKGPNISIPELHFTIPGLTALFNRQLYLRQPVFYVFLVPNAVDVAFPVQSRPL